MIFDHGMRTIDGVTRERFRVLMDAAPHCLVCRKAAATGIWMNPRNGDLVPMCDQHFRDYADDGEDETGAA